MQASEIKDNEKQKYTQVDEALHRSKFGTMEETKTEVSLNLGLEEPKQSNNELKK